MEAMFGFKPKYTIINKTCTITCRLVRKWQNTFNVDIFWKKKIERQDELILKKIHDVIDQYSEDGDVVKSLNRNCSRVTYEI